MVIYTPHVNPLSIFCQIQKYYKQKKILNIEFIDKNQNPKVFFNHLRLEEFP